MKTRWVSEQNCLVCKTNGAIIYLAGQDLWMNSLSGKMNMKRKLLMLWTLRSECKKAIHYFLLIHSKQELRALLHKWGTEAMTRNIWKQKNKKCPIYTIKRKEIHCSLSLWAINVFILIYVQGKNHYEDNILLMHWVASYLIMKRSNIVLKCTALGQGGKLWRNLICGSRKHSNNEEI